MSNRLFSAVLLALIVVGLAATPASAQSSGGCARVGISIQTGTSTVAPGTTIGIAGSVNNCSARKARYYIAVTALSSCGQQVSIAWNRMALGANENKMYTISHALATTTCAGPWEATVKVSDNGGVLATSSTTITIQ